MFYKDTNHLVSWADTTDTVLNPENEGKRYTRSFFGYPYTASDHTVLVYAKKRVSLQQRKNVGSWTAIVYVHPFASFLENHDLHKGMARLWFDLWYKYQEDDGLCYTLAKSDTAIQEYAATLFGKTGQALFMATYESCFTQDTVVSFLFGVCVAQGKRFIKDSVLFPIKITLPCTSSLLGKEDMLFAMTQALHAYGIIHTVQRNTTADYPVVQIVLHDPFVLRLFQKRVNPIVNIQKISTDETAQYVHRLILQQDTLFHDNQIAPFASSDAQKDAILASYHQASVAGTIALLTVD